ncbi:MAG: hypothetical protein IH978_00645 [Nitrospinae bacterium]|nr:hypothetical protein [Nitrospinota bacterium]
MRDQAGRTLTVYHGHQGFALVAALLLVVVVGIVAATVLQTTSTEIKISGNHRRAVQDFYVAEAGLAEGQARLHTRAGVEQFVMFDLAQRSNPFWSVYILTSSTWEPQDDPNFSSQYLNLIPQPGNPTSTAVQPNSVQSALPYWVKLRHKTEYDAEQAGHRTSTPHYFDGDGRTSTHRSPNVGNVIYFGYPNINITVPGPFTTQGSTPWLPIELITSNGGKDIGGVLLETEAVHPAGPNHLGALYAVGDVILSGQSGIFNGHDACGVVSSLPPVYSGSSVTAGPAFQFDGIPATPVQGSVVLDLVQSIGDLSRGAIPIQSDLLNQQLGSSSVPETYLATVSGLPNSSRLLIRNTVGHGILLVDGTAIFEGQVSWQGMIIVTGDLLIQGDGAVINVNGGIWARNVQHTGGSLNIQYDSCQIQASLLSRPVQVQSWKEVF